MQPRFDDPRICRLLARLMSLERVAVSARLTAASILSAIAFGGGLRVALAEDEELLGVVMRGIGALLEPGAVSILSIDEGEEIRQRALANVAREGMRSLAAVMQLAAELVTSAPSLQTFDAAAIATGLPSRVLEAARQHIKSIRSPIEEDRSLAALGTTACVRVLTTLCRPEQPDRALSAHLIGSGTCELLVVALVSTSFVGEKPSISAPQGPRLTTGPCADIAGFMTAPRLESLKASCGVLAELAVGDPHLRVRIESFYIPVIDRLCRLPLRAPMGKDGLEIMSAAMSQMLALRTGTLLPPQAFVEAVGSLIGVWTDFATAARVKVKDDCGRGEDGRVTIPCSLPACSKLSTSHKACARCALAYCAPSGQRRRATDFRRLRLRLPGRGLARDGVSEIV